LIVPVFGANPIQVQILTQVFNVFVLPAVIIGILLILRKSDVMKGYKAPLWVQLSLYAALLFSCIISYNGILAVLEYFN
jgi:Mn2+/Fe2+ NRAMP family transporter